MKHEIRCEHLADNALSVLNVIFTIVSELWASSSELNGIRQQDAHLNHSCKQDACIMRTVAAVFICEYPAHNNQTDVSRMPTSKGVARKMLAICSHLCDQCSQLQLRHKSDEVGLVRPNWGRRICRICPVSASAADSPPTLARVSHFFARTSTKLDHIWIGIGPRSADID